MHHGIGHMVKVSPERSGRVLTREKVRWGIPPPDIRPVHHPASDIWW